MLEWNIVSKKFDSILDEKWNNSPLSNVNYQEYIKHAKEGSLSYKRAYSLSYFLNLFKPKNILEIGGYLGFSCRFIYEISKSWNPSITSIDPNTKHRIFDTPRDYFNLMCDDCDNKIKLLDGFFLCYKNEAKWDYLNRIPILSESETDELIDKIPIITSNNLNEKIDFAILCAMHDYDFIIESFINLSQIMLDKGAIFFDDYNENWSSVIDAVSYIEKCAVQKKLGIVLYCSNIAIFIDNGFFSYVKSRKSLI
jgi:hypothetical protein